MEVIIDIETEGLVNPQKIHLIVCRDVKTNETSVFRNVQENPDPFIRFTRGVSRYIGHNIIGFDLPAINRICNLSIPVSQCIDTLVVSRTITADIEGGHSLEAWGTRLKLPKGDFRDFTEWSQEMEDYCIQDVSITYALYKKFLSYLQDKTWRISIDVEHQMAEICQEMSANGFYFKKDDAKKLHEEILGRLEVLDKELAIAFPPRTSCIRQVTPKATKFGTISMVDFRWLTDKDLSPFSVGASFSVFEYIPFNAGSPKQIVERLNEAGWKPFEKTKTHLQVERELRDYRISKVKRTALEERLEHFKQYGWKVSEGNLNTLPKDAPEAARKLVQRLLLDSRRSTLQEWLTAVSEADSRIHGNFHHIGAWTHRMSHSNPNQANIPSGRSEYAHEMRSLFSVPPNRLLVGVDADGIQLRILAHYMNDKVFTDALISGDKEKETDAHSLNKKALGDVCLDRDVAKTFIYAWLLGAGVNKVAEILNCSYGEALEASEKFLSFYPSLKALKTVQIPQDAERGYFVGLDKRLVSCSSKHLMLAGYLQNGEAVVMKHANILWREKLRKEGIPFWQVNFVHDEWQTETVNDIDVATHIAKTQADAIREVGERLGLRCPLAGSIMNSYKKLAIGSNWSETH
jgi:DNA polymerase-1